MILRGEEKKQSGHEECGWHSGSMQLCTCASRSEEDVPQPSPAPGAGTAWEGTSLRRPPLPTWVILHHDGGHGPVAGVVGVVRLAVGVAVHVGDVGLVLREG